MGEEREGDARVQLIIGFFLVCILGGGVFLCLYVFLPGTKASKWYYIVGIILEAIPWVFWLLTYLYATCKPGAASRRNAPGQHSSRRTAATPASASQDASPTAEDQHHVHFGLAVLEEGDTDRGHHSGNNSHTGSASDDLEYGSRESEMPLKFGDSSCK